MKVLAEFQNVAGNLDFERDAFWRRRAKWTRSRRSWT